MFFFYICAQRIIRNFKHNKKHTLNSLFGKSNHLSELFDVHPKNKPLRISQWLSISKFYHSSLLK